jgi:hypothetical protein
VIAQTDLVQLFVEGMARGGYVVTSHEAWLEHRDSGIAIRPRVLESPSAPPFIRSVVVVTTSHPRLPPNGIFEYQHAVASTQREAISNGIDQWLQIDFPVLLDALRDRPEHCMAMEWQFERNGLPGLSRRALLGPVGHLAAHPERAKGGAHPFCPCCLLTNTFEAFRPLVEADGFYAIRLLASRDENGSTQADCRINGSEWESGKRALCSYADTWPQAGLEMRKQYIVLQTVGHKPN